MAYETHRHNRNIGYHIVQLCVYLSAYAPIVVHKKLISIMNF